MEKKKWEQEYPQMPEEFRRLVRVAVDYELGQPKRPGTALLRKRKVLKRCFLLGAAAVLLWGMAAVVADKEFDFRKYLEEYGLPEGKSDNDEAYFFDDIQVKIEKDNPASDQALGQEERENDNLLLEIKEVMYDGTNLAIYGEYTEEGKNYVLSGDKIFVNGEAVYCDHIEGGKDYLVFAADIHNACNQDEDTFQVIWPIAAAGKDHTWIKDATRYKAQNLAFSMEVIEGKTMPAPTLPLLRKRIRSIRKHRSGKKSFRRAAAHFADSSLCSLISSSLSCKEFQCRFTGVSTAFKSTGAREAVLKNCRKSSVCFGERPQRTIISSEKFPPRWKLSSF